MQSGSLYWLVTCGRQMRLEGFTGTERFSLAFLISSSVADEAAKVLIRKGLELINLGLKDVGVA